MAESKEPQPSRPKPPANAPLPRLWKVAPEEPDEPEPKKKKKGRSDEQEQEEKAKAEKKAKTDKKGKDSKKKVAKKPKDGAVLLEETPGLDTYQARQTARILMGVAILVVLALIVFGVMKWSSSGSSEEEIATGGETPPVTQGPVVAKQDVELEAHTMFERAREVAKNGKGDQAVLLLKKVSTSYPNTKAGEEAREALERPKQNLPLFLDRSAVVASAKESDLPPSKTEPNPNVVEAVAPTTPGKATAVANLVLPANPAEPTRAVIPGSHPGEPTDSRPLPAGFRARTDAGAHASGWPLQIVGDRDGATMVLVPGGSFLMGRDDGEPAERPAHRVTLSTYYIDQHEVTARQYDLFLKETGRTARAPGAAGSSPDRPSVMVNSHEAEAYAQWAGKRLPTEAQWEMAARTPDGRIYPWGPTPPAWNKPRAARQIDPVMSFPNDVSPYGVFDLAGNAWEWTSDWYDSKAYQAARDQVLENPTVPASRSRSQQMTVRGGSKTWLASWREGMKPDVRLAFLGFRCALPVESGGQAQEAAAPPGAAPPAPATRPRNTPIPF